LSKIHQINFSNKSKTVVKRSWHQYGPVPMFYVPTNCHFCISFEFEEQAEYLIQYLIQPAKGLDKSRAAKIVPDENWRSHIS